MDNSQQEPVIDTSHKSGLLTRLRGYFIAGVLVTAPITITAWLTLATINFIDNSVTGLFPENFNPETNLPFSVPGLGILIVVVFLILIGMLATNFMGRFFVRMGESILDRLPVIRSLYSGTKQIFETVLANQSEAFREVVLIEYPRKDMWTIAFVTGIPKGEIQDKTKSSVVNVFVPTTPNPTSGFLLFVPNEDVIRLKMSVEAGMKLVISGGIVSPDTVETEKKSVKKTIKNKA